MTDGVLPKRARDLRGKTFGSLTVVRFAGLLPPRNVVLWECRCRCGVVVTREGQQLNRLVADGYAPSCPRCKWRRQGQSVRTHGMSKHPAFMAWCSMRARCRDPRRTEWKNYGGRGIVVCQEWDTSFDAFWRDMGSTWREGLEIDRRDNNGNYTPDNCRWATIRQNVNNRRNTHPVDMRQLATQTGVPLRTLYTRWYRGQSMTSKTPDPERVSWSWAMTARS